MARTKASVGAKIASGKSSKARCSVAPPASSGSSAGSTERSGRSTSGGNSVCPRETPKWQKPITNFFIGKEKGSDSEEDVDKIEAGCSKSKPKKNIIQSDDEEPELINGTSNEQVTNKTLDDSIELEPLNGEDSHKIEEYYTKNSKGKGVGKKTKDKENVDSNVAKRNSLKRDLEAVVVDDESPRATKKVKVN